MPDAMGLPPCPWPPAPLAPGTDATSPKLANRAYNSIVSGMLAEAQHKFKCLIFTEDTYLDIHTQIRWAFECWEAICSKNKTFFELSKEMMNLVCLCMPSPTVADYYHEYRSKGGAPMPEVQSYSVFTLSLKDPSTRIQAASPQFARTQCMFNGPRSCAVLNHAKFNPISLPSIALVCTIVRLSYLLTTFLNSNQLVCMVWTD